MSKNKAKPSGPEWLSRKAEGHDLIQCEQALRKQGDRCQPQSDRNVRIPQQANSVVYVVECGNVVETNFSRITTFPSNADGDFYHMSDWIDVNQDGHDYHRSPVADFWL